MSLDRLTFALHLAAITASVLFRLRFVWTPLTSNEGGYLAIGRACIVMPDPDTDLTSSAV